MGKRYAFIENGGILPPIDRMKLVDTMYEEALYCILSDYDGNEMLTVSGGYHSFPAYMKYSYKEVFEGLKKAGILASFIQDLSKWIVHLTPAGLTYFDDKRRYLEEAEMQFYILPENSKNMLDAILRTENPVQMLSNQFRDASSEEDGVLRGILRELIQAGYIQIHWADNIPWNVIVNNSARTYDERLNEFQERSNVKPVTAVSIGTINAQQGLVSIGDIHSSTISFDYSFEDIKLRIMKDGAEDKDVMNQLLDETKELIELIQVERRIPNKGFHKKVSAHMEKHGWFYGAIMGLIGNAVLVLL